MRPVSRRWEPSDLETARRVVARAERQALDKAEHLRKQAEDLLLASSQRTVETERRVRAETAVEIDSLRSEMEKASQRTTELEREVERLRSENEALLAAPIPPPATTERGVMPTYRIEIEDFDESGAFLDLSSRMKQDTDRLVRTASLAATRLHRQADVDLNRAKDEAEQIVDRAHQEAEQMLRAALEAIERDRSIIAAAREQADRDSQVAYDARQVSEQVLADARTEAHRILTEARAQGSRMTLEASAEAARMKATGESERRRLAEAARQEAEEAWGVLRQDYINEIAMLRDHMSTMRGRLDVFIGDDDLSSEVDKVVDLRERISLASSHPGT